MYLEEQLHGSSLNRLMLPALDALTKKPTSFKCKHGLPMNPCLPSSDVLNAAISGRKTNSISSAILITLFLLATLFMGVSSGEMSFKIVVFTCIWQRPLLTEFVFEHYASLKPTLLEDHKISLELFAVGSEGERSSAIAKKFNVSYAEHPNEPLGSKHNYGLSVLRDRISDLDAVVIVGSDDVLNQQYFVTVKDLMRRELKKKHLVGLRDLFVYDLGTDRLVYTRGYKVATTNVAATIGLGRALSRDLLESMNWFLWDSERNHGLDQSSVRRLLSEVIGVDDVSTAIVGKENDIVAIDIKTKGAGGTNIWAFDSVLRSVGKDGRLHQFDFFGSRSTLTHYLGADFVSRLQLLVKEMKVVHDTLDEGIER